jgi:hypothetical protein
MIPFVQYLRPDGYPRDVEIDLPAGVEALAQQFLEAGGRYECELLRDETVSLTAAFEIDGEVQDIACVLCPNGPGVPDSAAELVHKSIRFLERGRTL